MPLAPAEPAEPAEPGPSPGNGGIAAVIVLAAGAGTRMRSQLPKVLHPLAGKPLLWHALSAAAGVAPRQLVAVLGHGRDDVTTYLAGAADLPRVTTAIQEEQRGTGHACACALAVTGELSGTVLVTYGDVPLLRTSTLLALATEHTTSGNAVTVLTAQLENPTGYGRITRDPTGQVTGVVEQKDADAQQCEIREINSGVYAFEASVLADALGRLSDANAAGEQYLTDVVGIAHGDGLRVGAVKVPEAVETEGVNDRVQLSELARVLNARLVRHAQLAGVTVHDPGTTWIHADVTIGPDTEILPGTQLQAGTAIGSGASVGPDTTLIACTVGDGASVIRSHCHSATIGARASVGPFTYLRPGAVLAEGSKVGAYVEVKNSTVGPGSKVPHLSYIGDTTIGTGSNIGAGTITANYDGDHKFATVIGDRSFIGSNSTLVAPVTIHDGGYVAAGSTVTTDVGPGDLAVARGRQRDVTGWTVRRRPASASAAAASLALAARQTTSDPAEFGPANPARTSGSQPLTPMATTPTSSTGNTTPAEGDQPA